MSSGRIFLAGAAVALLAYMYSYSTSRPTVVEKLLPSYDYIIVGAGSAGSVLAARLSEDPNATVLVLEAGGEETQEWKLHVPFVLWDNLGTAVDWIYYTETQKHSHYAMRERRSFWPRGRVLGGSSVLNGMVYIRGSPHDYDNWAELGCDGWSYKDVLPYFLKSEDIRIDQLKSSKYHSTGGPLVVSDTSYPPFDEITLRAAKEIGLNVVDCNGYDVIGVCSAQSTVEDGVRASTARQFLRPAMSRSNLHVATYSLVTKVNVENKRAVGVDFVRNGRKQKVEAKKEVLLSSGSIGSAQLLMLSGIGPKEHLHGMKIPLVANLPVGTTLEDHFIVFVPAYINSSGTITKEDLDSIWTKLNYNLLGKGPLASNFGLQGVAFFHVSDSIPDRTLPEIQFQFVSSIYERFDFPNKFNYDEKMIHHFKKDPNSPLKEGFFITVTDLHPKSHGTIRLRSANPFDYPVIDPDYLSHPDDMQKLLKGIRISEEYFSTPTFQKIGAELKPFEPCSAKHNFRSDEYWDCYIRYTGVTQYHPTTTCKMGAQNDPTAVVDTKLRVKGISGLRVVDASVMPHVLGGNTNAATIMIAEKAADMIRGKDTVKQFRDRFS